MSNMDNRIITPKATDALEERALALSSARLLSFVDRAELAGITTLMIQGGITRASVWQVLLNFYSITEDGDETFLAQPRADLAEVWMRLDSLASNCPSASPEEQDSSERSKPRWLVDTMHLIERELSSSRLYVGDVVDLLPEELTYDLRQRVVSKNYGSPMAIGYSLEAGGGFGGIGFGAQGQSIWVADALAEALLHAVNVYDEIIDPASDAAKIELGRIRLWWMLLKGFAYSLAHRRQGMPTLPTLVDHPEMLELIKQALTIGLDRLSAASIETTPKWVGVHSGINSKVKNMPTPELIELLEKRVDEERADMEVFHR